MCCNWNDGLTSQVVLHVFNTIQIVYWPVYLLQMVDEIVAGIDDLDIRDYILGVVGDDPNFMVLVAAREERTGTTIQPPWCKCGHCRPMPTEIEQKCCRVFIIRVWVLIRRNTVCPYILLA